MIYRILVVIVLMIGQLGCTTAYGPVGLTGGYSDIQLDANTCQVIFRGNAYTSRETVKLYLLYRCAEVTNERGFDFFCMVNESSYSKEIWYTTSGSSRSRTTGTLRGNRATFRTRGTYTPGTTFKGEKPSAVAEIKMYKGKKPNVPGFYSAKEVLKYLGPSIKRN